MRAIVVDASAVAAVLFNEPEGEPVLASVCAAKLSRKPGEATTTLSRYRLFLDLEIELIEPDWTSLPSLARAWSIPLYDAAYLQLALARKVNLVTLDARLAAAYDEAQRRK